VAIAPEKRYWLRHHFCSTPREPRPIKFKLSERVVRGARGVAGARRIDEYDVACSQVCGLIVVVIANWPRPFYETVSSVVGASL